jgi:hypothetical protein
MNTRVQNLRISVKNNWRKWAPLHIEKHASMHYQPFTDKNSFTF